MTLRTFVLLLILIILSVVWINPKTTAGNIELVEKFTDNIVKINQDRDVFSWDAENLLYDWAYYNGFMMYALTQTGKYNDFVEKYYQERISKNGEIKSYKFGELDSVLSARALFYLDKKKYKPAIEFVYNNLKKHEQIPELGNNYIHKMNNHQWVRYPISLDGTYMALTFLAEYGEYQLVYEKMIWFAEKLKDTNGLYNHGISYKGSKNRHVWLRGVGWYAMAQVDIIELMPEGKEKEELKKKLVPFFDNMLKYRNPFVKMWRNVINPETFIYNNKFETSGSAMMSYAMLKACNEKFVQEKYCDAGLETFNSIVHTKLRKNILKDIYLSSNVKFYEQDYCDNIYADNDAKGIAPLILAAIEAKKFNIRRHKTQIQDAR